MSYTDFSLYLEMYDQSFTKTPLYATLNTSMPRGFHNRPGGNTLAEMGPITWLVWRLQRCAHLPWGTFMPFLVGHWQGWRLHGRREHHISFVSVWNDRPRTYSPRVQRGTVDHPLSLRCSCWSPPSWPLQHKAVPLRDMERMHFVGGIIPLGIKTPQAMRMVWFQYMPRGHRFILVDAESELE